MQIKKLLIFFGFMVLSLQSLSATQVKDAFLEEFPTGLWKGSYRYVSCEDSQLSGEGIAHLTVNRAILDDDTTRVTIDGTLLLVGFPDTETSPSYNKGVELNTSSIIKTNNAGVYNVYLNLFEGPSFTAANGYQPRANTLVAAIAACQGNPYTITLVLYPPAS